MLIGELVKKSGVSKDTIRYYEKIGVLDSRVISRNPDNGYKIYSQQVLEALGMIGFSKQHGATLMEIKEMLNAYYEGDLTCQLLAPYLTQKLKEVENRIEDLQQQKRKLEESLCIVQTCVIESKTGKDFVSLID